MCIKTRIILQAKAKIIVGVSSGGHAMTDLHASMNTGVLFATNLAMGPTFAVNETMETDMTVTMTGVIGTMTNVMTGTTISQTEKTERHTSTTITRLTKDKKQQDHKKNNNN